MRTGHRLLKVAKEVVDASEKFFKAFYDFRATLLELATEVNAAIREKFEEEEPTSPGVPKPASRQMPAVTGHAKRIEGILEEGKPKPRGEDEKKP